MTTTDEAPLLRAVLLHPDCDTPRLLYADWLDENDKAERAEFIRVQCELARCGPCPATIYHPQFDEPDHGGRVYVVPPPQEPKKPCGLCPVCKLRRREGELFWTVARAVEKKLPVKWRWSPVQSHPGIEGGFSRGFVSHITPPLADYLAHAAAVFGSQPVERVTLSGREFSSEGGCTAENDEDIAQFSDRLSFDWWEAKPRPSNINCQNFRDVLPVELFSVMWEQSPKAYRREGAYNSTNRWVEFPSTQLADDALSAACVLHGRRKAGLISDPNRND